MDIKNLTADQALEQYDYFEMFSAAGDKACKDLVKKVFKKIGGKYRTTQDDITQMITAECKKVAQKHREVYDTEPGWNIQELVNKKLQEIGYCFEVSRYDF